MDSLSNLMPMLPTRNLVMTNMLLLDCLIKLLQLHITLAKSTKQEQWEVEEELVPTKTTFLHNKQTLELKNKLQHRVLLSITTNQIHCNSPWAWSKPLQWRAMAAVVVNCQNCLPTWILWELANQSLMLTGKISSVI